MKSLYFMNSHGVRLNSNVTLCICLLPVYCIYCLLLLVVKITLTMSHRYSYSFTLAQFLDLCWGDCGSYLLISLFNICSKLKPQLLAQYIGAIWVLLVLAINWSMLSYTSNMSKQWAVIFIQLYFLYQKCLALPDTLPASRLRSWNKSLYSSTDFNEFFVSLLVNYISSLPVTFYWKHCCPTYSDGSSKSLISLVQVKLYIQRI